MDEKNGNSSREDSILKETRILAGSLAGELEWQNRELDELEKRIDRLEARRKKERSQA